MKVSKHLMEILGPIGKRAVARVKLLGHRNIKNTLIYTQLVKPNDNRDKCITRCKGEFRSQDCAHSGFLK